MATLVEMIFLTARADLQAGSYARQAASLVITPAVNSIWKKIGLLIESVDSRSTMQVLDKTDRTLFTHCRFTNE
jgi:hypothetical protein